MPNDTVAIILVTFNSKDHLSKSLLALSKQSHKNYLLVHIDNASNDSSTELVKNKITKLHQVINDSNIGFAPAVNQAFDYLLSKQFKYYLILNPDVILDSNCLSNLIASHQSLSTKLKIGLIQPVLLCEKDRNKINTIGNTMHYLGFGFCSDYGEQLTSHNLESDEEILSVSGAALFGSAEYLKTVGYLTDHFYMYNEDQDFSWRGLLSGYSHFLSVQSIAYHDYSYSRNTLKWMYSETNRLSMLFQNYSAKTLAILFPAIIFTEFVSIAYSVINGLFLSKMRSYLRLFSNITAILKQRKSVQQIRKVSDTTLLKRFSSNLSFQPVGYAVIASVLSKLFLYYKKLVLTLFSH